MVPAIAHAQPAVPTYTLDAGATITYVTPTTSAPVTVQSSESLSGTYSISLQSSSPYYGAHEYAVTDFHLTTASGKHFDIASGDTSSDLPCFDSYGYCQPKITLNATGFAPATQTVIQTSGLVLGAPVWEGDETNPTGFAWNQPNPGIVPGVEMDRFTGLDSRGEPTYELVAVISFHATRTTPLGNGQWVVATGAQPTAADYSAMTTSPYWSAVMFSPGYLQTNNPNPIVDYKMQMFDSSGNQLAQTASTYPSGEPDYIAIDGNIRSPQTYTARVIQNQSNDPGEQYRMVFLNGNTILYPGTTYISAATSQPNNAYIRDVYLNAGTSVEFFVGGSGVICPSNVGTLYLHAFLLGSDPTNPSTGVQSRSSALASSESITQTPSGCGVTLHYNVFRSAWYGLLIFDPDFSQVVITMNSSNLIS